MDPRQIGRLHKAQVNVVHFSKDNERLYSGDATGVVACTLTRTFRAAALWNAHTDSILTISEWEDRIITHARDNKLHVWAAIPMLPAVADTATTITPAYQPSLLYSLDVNALNFCRFSLLPLPRPHREGFEALLAVPNLVESAFTDIWSLPGLDRIHAAIGKLQNTAGVLSPPNEDAGRAAENKQGVVMSHHLFTHHVPNSAPSNSEAGQSPQLRLLVGYESGAVMLFARSRSDAEVREKTIEGRGWDALWSCKLHVESVMAMTISPDASFALTVSADHLIGKYILADHLSDTTERAAIYRTKRPGNGAIAIRHDGRVCAVGGWDGTVRLYSTKTFKPLQTLRYHSQAVYALAFAHPPRLRSIDEDDDWHPADEETRGRWFISAGKEGRIATWELDSFEKPKAKEGNI